MPETEPKIVFLHGCTDEEIRGLLKATRAALGPERYREFAFCTSTPTNLEWKLKDLVADVWEEHEYMRLHPPGTDSDDAG